MNQLTSATEVKKTFEQMPHLGAGTRSAEKPVTQEVIAKAVTEAAEAHAVPLTKEQQTEATLRSVKSTFMMPAQLEFFGMLGGGALGWVAKKFKWDRAQAAVGVVAKAPVQAMRKTSLAEILQLPGNVADAARKEAAGVGGAAGGWATTMGKHSDTLLDGAKGIESQVANHVKPHLDSIGNGLDRLQTTGFGKKLQNGFKWLADNRANAANKKHTAALANVHDALHTEATGMGKSITNFVTRKKAATVEAGELDSVLKGLNTLNEHEGNAAKSKHLQGLLTTFEDKVKSGSLTGEVKSRAGTVLKHLQKAVSSANALETYEHAATGGSLKAMAGAMAKAIGRVPVYNALLTVGVTAGLGAVIVAGHGESKEANAALKKLNGELADQPHSSFLKSVKAAQQSGKHWGTAKTGMRLVGEVAEGAMWMMPHGGGAGMMGAMMLPQLCEMMVPGNTMLGALEALDKSDKGTLVLKPADRIQLLTQVIGGMESVAAHGGQYNRLAKTMAGEMQERGFKYHDVVQLLGNDKAFNTFASEVSAKQQAVATKTATEVKAAAPVAAETPAPMIATGPTNRIGVGAGAAQHKGMVVDNRQLAMA